MPGIWCVDEPAQNIHDPSQYLRSLFGLTTINPLETAGLRKILHILAVSLGILQILSFILTHLFRALLLFS